MILLMFLSISLVSLTFSIWLGDILKTVMWPPDYPAISVCVLSPIVKEFTELAVVSYPIIWNV
jgi:hypothetical protein